MALFQCLVAPKRAVPCECGPEPGSPDELRYEIPDFTCAVTDSRAQLLVPGEDFRQNLEPEVKERWQRGLPRRWRQELWPLALGAEAVAEWPAVGSDVNITRDVQRLPSTLLLEVLHEASAAEITHGPMDPQELRTDVERVLLAGCASGVRYESGMGYIVCVLLAYLPVEQAAACFAVLGRSVLERLAAVRAELAGFRRTLHANAPEIALHFEDLGVPIDAVWLDWAFTLFAKSFPVHLAAAVWDQMLLESPGQSPDAVCRAAVAILTLLEPDLRKAWSLEAVAPLLQARARTPSVARLKPEQLLDTMSQVNSGVGAIPRAKGDQGASLDDAPADRIANIGGCL